MKKALKFMDWINKKVCYVSMGAAFFLMCMTTVHAIMRKFFRLGGFTDSLNITELSMILIVFCAFAFMESQYGHIKVDILSNILPKKFNTGLHGGLLVLTAIFLYFLFYAITSHISTVFTSHAASIVLRIPHWPFYVVMSVSLFTYATTVLLHAIEKFLQVKDVVNVKNEKKEINDVDITTQM